MMKKVIYKSHEYPSITALCNRFNVNYGAFKSWCRRQGIIDLGFGLSLYRRTCENKQNLAKYRQKLKQAKAK